MLSRSYLTVTFGFGLRSLLLSVLVVLLARALGPSEFGGYAAAASLASFFATFNGFGAGALHVRDVAHGKPYMESLNRTMRWVGISAPPLAAIAIGCAWILIPHNVEPFAIVLIVFGEILYYISSDVAMRLLQAREHYIGMTLVICALPALRVLIAGMLLFAGALGLMAWALVSGAIGALAAGALFGLWIFRTRGSVRDARLAPKDRLAGLGFAMAAASSRVHGDADKVILANLVSTSMTGSYTLSYRLVDVFLLPISAGVERVLPALFKRGQHGLSHSLQKSAREIALILVSACALCSGVYMFASILPWILGDAYRGTVVIAHALAAVPLTMTCWMIVRTLAATSGYERATGMFELAGAIFNVGATIALVLAWGWRGAVAATYLTHLAMIAGFASYIARRIKRMPTTKEETW